MLKFSYELVEVLNNKHFTRMLESRRNAIIEAVEAFLEHWGRLLQDVDIETFMAVRRMEEGMAKQHSKVMCTLIFLFSL